MRQKNKYPGLTNRWPVSQAAQLILLSSQGAPPPSPSQSWLAAAASQFKVATENIKTHLPKYKATTKIQMAGCLACCLGLGRAKAQKQGLNRSQPQRQRVSSPHACAESIVQAVLRQHYEMDDSQVGACKDGVEVVPAARQHDERIQSWSQMKLQINRFLSSGDSLSKTEHIDDSC